jgi:glycosyltransferase involved in cell wall biosynthesis
MHILQLTHRLPYPPTDGGKIGIFNFTKYFSSKEHRVSLIAIAPDVERNINIKSLNNLTADSQIFYKDVRNKKLGLLENTFFSSSPYSMAKYRFKDVEEYILDFIRNNKIDIVHIDHLHMAYYGRSIKNEFPALPVTIREHNVEYVILERLYLAERNRLYKALFKRQYERLKEYEKNILPVFDKILAITEEDRQRLIALDRRLGPKVEVIPAGVDLNEFESIDNDHAARNLLSIASMDWIPNQQGLVWFIENVMPELVRRNPAITLYIIGKNTPDWFHRYESENVKVLGFVEDISPWLKKSSVAVIPLFAGGGMRVKILNYLAWGIPTVSTSIGAEGINVADGENIFLADSADDFAIKIMNLLDNVDRWQQIRGNGRKLVENCYTWDAIIDRTLDIYRRLIGN